MKMEANTWLERSEVARTLQRLCGNWIDHKESKYYVELDGDWDMMVRTTRPCGRKIVTRGLIRVERSGSMGRVLWGKSGAQSVYKLAELTDEALMWRCDEKSDRNTFRWKKIPSDLEHSHQGRETIEQERDNGSQPGEKRPYYDYGDSHNSGYNWSSGDHSRDGWKQGWQNDQHSSHGSDRRWSDSADYSGWRDNSASSGRNSFQGQQDTSSDVGRHATLDPGAARAVARNDGSEQHCQQSVQQLVSSRLGTSVDSLG